MGKQTGPWGDVEAQFEAVLADAAKRYSDSAGTKLEEFMTPPMRSVDDLTRQLNLQNENFSHFREKRQKIFSAVATAMKPLDVIGDMVSGAASEVFPPAQNIYCAISYLINAAQDVSAMYDGIIELFEQLQDFTSRLNIYVQSKLPPGLREKLVAILVCLFEVLVISTKEVRRGRIKAYFKRIFGSESPVQPALEKLKALTLGEERQVIAETYGGVSQLNTKADRMDSKQDRMEAKLDEVNRNILENRERINAFHQDKLNEILQPTPFPTDFFKSFEKSRAENTGNWILKDSGMKSWLKTETQYLWICGGAGTGKSMLATRLVSWGLENLPHLGYFFFRANNPETRSVLQAMKDVAYQLSESDAFYAQQLLKNLHTAEDIKTIPSAFRKLFVEPFEDGDKGKEGVKDSNNAVTGLYIILDGIDEADPEEVEQVLEQFAGREQDTPKARNYRIQLAVTGRSYLTETVTFGLDPEARGSSVLTSLYITPERSARDVHSFIVDSINSSRNLSRSSPEFKKEVILAMEKQAGGLFILAKLMVEEIGRKRHKQSILSSLKSYPKDLFGMLMRSLSDMSAAMSEEEAADVNEMLTWVTCAEEALTLGQLEAVMVLKFGDPPFRLEETLRNQFAYFFELEREDGLTTNDLIQEHERQQRNRKNGSPGISPMRHLGAPATSQARQPSPNRPMTPKNQQSSAMLSHYSPGGSPDLGNSTSEIEYRSNKETTFVTFFHTSIKEFFGREDTISETQNHNGIKIGVNPIIARVHVLKQCLRIFVEKSWFEKLDLGPGRLSIKQYAAWYWQEEASRIDPEKVSAEDKKILAPYLYKMLTDEAIALEWTMMYQKNDEGLEVLTDNNIVGLRRWMADPGILAVLDSKAKTWITQEITKSPGIFRPIGQLYAKAWVAEDFRYIPTNFCFFIVQNIAFMEDGYDWSHASKHWGDISVEERIAKATAWAKQPQTAHFHRRVGSTFLTLGFHNKALEHYSAALKMDNNSVETCGRIAYCLWRDKRYEEALKQTLQCETMEEENIKSGKLDKQALSGSKWRLYKDHFLIGQCYQKIGKIDDALKYFRKAIDSSREAALGPAEYFEPEIRYLEVLSNDNRHEKIIEFLQEMPRQNTDTKYGKSKLIDFLLHQAKRTLVIDWIPRAASKVNQVGFLIDNLDISLEVANTVRDTLAILYLRLSLGATYAYSRNRDAAIGVFEDISLHEYRPKGNIPTRQGHALSFQKLAVLYKEKVLLDGGLKAPEASSWIQKLEHIQQKQDKYQNQDLPSGLIGSDFNLSAIYLALFYRVLGSRTAESTALLSALIKESLDTLSDEDPNNDEFALDNLLCILIAANDIENARALSQSMRKVNPNAASIATTPAESPTLQRLEPKLPEIQSLERSCAQCLDHIALAKDFYTCKLCLESFCESCMKTVIQQEKNKTSDRRVDVVCRADHEWFTVPPLNQTLHRGEMLLGNGKIMNFSEWKANLRKQWDGMGVKK